MAKYVKVAAVQFETRAQRGTPDAQEILLEETHNLLKSLEGEGLNLIVLCECVEAIGQTIETAEQVDDPGPFLETYSHFASSQRCYLAGSVKIREAEHVYNSIAFLGPQGNVLGVYHKSYLTDSEMDTGLHSGKGAVVIDTEIGRLGGVICFDLNFEPLRQQYRVLKPDILAFASMYHGGLMQGVWAYDCRCYFVSALPFPGAGIVDPFGRIVQQTHCYTKVAKATLNLDRAIVHLDKNRERLSEIMSRYGDNVFIDIPPNIGSALIFSHLDDVSAMDIVAEYELVLLDDYFSRAIADNDNNRS